MARLKSEAHEYQTVANAALRVHRHEILNGLQLVRAYIQLERPERALSAISDLSQWLQSLSLAQSAFEADAPELLWLAAECSRVRIATVEDGVHWTESAVTLLADFWRWLHEQAGAVGAGPFRLEIRGGEAVNRASVRLRLCVTVRSSADQTLCGQVQAYIDQHARTQNANEVEFTLTEDG